MATMTACLPQPQLRSVSKSIPHHPTPLPLTIQLTISTCFVWFMLTPLPLQHHKNNPQFQWRRRPNHCTSGDTSEIPLFPVNESAGTISPNSPLLTTQQLLQTQICFTALLLLFHIPTPQSRSNTSDPPHAILTSSINRRERERERAHASTRSFSHSSPHTNHQKPSVPAQSHSQHRYLAPLPFNPTNQTN